MTGTVDAPAEQSRKRLIGPTVSVLAYEPETSSLGILIASSSPAIGARCPYILPGKAVLTSQGATNLELGPLALDLLQMGLSGSEVFESLRQYDRSIDYRQLAMISIDGNVQAHTGSRCLKDSGHVVDNAVVVIGNGLEKLKILENILHAFLGRKGALPQRLLSSFQTSINQSAPEQGRKLFSACLLVASKVQKRKIDLRVDYENQGRAVENLRFLHDLYQDRLQMFEQDSEHPDLSMAENAS